MDDSYKIMIYLSDKEIARRGLEKTTYNRREYFVERVISRGGNIIMEAFRVISNWSEGYIVHQVEDDILYRIDKHFSRRVV
jgi:hypothetical protein